MDSSLLVTGCWEIYTKGVLLVVEPHLLTTDVGIHSDHGFLPGPVMRTVELVAVFRDPTLRTQMSQACAKCAPECESLGMMLCTSAYS